MTYPPLDFTPMWARVNDELIELVDLFPDEKLNWSPRPELWNIRGILLHVCFGRYGLTQLAVQDGAPMPDVLQLGQSRDGLKGRLRASWERMQAFLSKPELLAKEYDIPYQGKTARLSGHWIAFGLLEHDIHHRADAVHYLGLLGIAHLEPDSVERRMKELVGAT